MLERLSSLHIGPVQSLTGARPLSSLSAGLTTPPSSLGKLKEVKQLTVLGETYLQLEGVSDDHCSIILTSHLKTVVDEMTALCRDTGELIWHSYEPSLVMLLFSKIMFFFSCAVWILEQTLRSPYVFYGGGCMEAITAQYLRQKVSAHLLRQEP